LNSKLSEAKNENRKETFFNFAYFLKLTPEFVMLVDAYKDNPDYIEQGSACKKRCLRRSLQVTPRDSVKGRVGLRVLGNGDPQASRTFCVARLSMLPCLFLFGVIFITFELGLCYQ
jgi:hypothetical protein